MKFVRGVFFLGELPIPTVISKRARLFPVDTLVEFGKLLGFDSVQSTDLLKFHDKRIIYRALLLLVFVLPIFAICLFFLIYSFTRNVPTKVLIIILLPIVFYLGLVISIKLLILFVDNNFADSLCIDTAFQILFVLSRDDVLVRPDKKIILIQYINYLEKYLARIGDKYTSNEERTSWKYSNFLAMSRFAKERKKWAIMPKDSTLPTLREDFYHLSKILVTGNYGNFEQIESNKEETIDYSSKSQKIFLRFFKFVGYLFPTVLLGLYLWNSELFPGILIDKQVISLVMLAWLLISIDIGFNLGIVSSLIATAKGLRDIEKI